MDYINQFLRDRCLRRPSHEAEHEKTQELVPRLKVCGSLSVHSISHFCVGEYEEIIFIP